MAQLAASSMNDFGVQHISIPGMQISIGPGHINFVNSNSNNNLNISLNSNQTVARNSNTNYAFPNGLVNNALLGVSARVDQIPGVPTNASPFPMPQQQQQLNLNGQLYQQPPQMNSFGLFHPHHNPHQAHHHHHHHQPQQHPPNQHHHHHPPPPQSGHLNPNQPGFHLHGLAAQSLMHFPSMVTYHLRDHLMNRNISSRLPGMNFLNRSLEVNKFLLKNLFFQLRYLLLFFRLKDIVRFEENLLNLNRGASQETIEANTLPYKYAKVIS